MSESYESRFSNVFLVMMIKHFRTPALITGCQWEARFDLYNDENGIGMG